MPAESMFGYVFKGGIFMYPILVCSIISLAIFLEKSRVLQRRRVIPQGFLTDFEHLLRAEKIAQALELCKDTDAPISRILSGGIKNYGKRREVIKELIEEVGRREAAYLEKYVEALATIANVATLLGLLGTIAGMIKIFGVIAQQALVNPSMLAGGISEALYTTGAGLGVAIPTLIFYRIITGKADSLILEMEEYSLRMVELIKEQRS